MDGSNITLTKKYLTIVYCKNFELCLKIKLKWTRLQNIKILIHIFLSINTYNNELFLTTS